MSKFKIVEFDNGRLKLECDRSEFELLVELLMRYNNGTLSGFDEDDRYQLGKLDKSIYRGALLSSYSKN